MSFLSCCKFESNHSFKDNNSFKESVADTSKAFNRNGNRFSFFIKSMSHKTGSSRHRRISEEVMKVGNAKVSARVFSYQELAAATNNFNDDCLVGEGGFGKVYKGRVQSTDQDVAIKQLDKNGRQGNREFLSEVLMLNLVQHQNLVKLIGYCIEDEYRMLVYEFLINGSLEDHLLDLPPGKEPLDWNTRMKIAVGAAKGLEYLHHVSKPSIIYRDFKASNILLDADFNPKLSDFGLAKLAPSGEQELVSTRVMGTYGYCAPEYQRNCQLTTKSDVYGFGVVFLELITGRRVIDVKRPTEEQNLIYWAEPLFKDKSHFTKMADPLLQENYPKKGLYQALAIAATCLQEESDTRPFMSDVVSALQFLVKPKAEEQVDRISLKCSSRYVDSVIEGNASENQGV